MTKSETLPKKVGKKGRPIGGVQAKEERQKQVAELKNRGWSNTGISKVLGISRNTIAQDLKELDEQSKKTIIDIDRYKEIGEAVNRFREIEEKALREHLLLGDDGSSKEKLDCLARAQAARMARIQLLFDSGVIPKVSEQSEGAVLYEKISNYTEPEMLEYEKELQKELGLSMDLPELEKEDKKRTKRWKKKQDEMAEGIDVSEEEANEDFFLQDVPKEVSAEDAESIFTEEELRAIAGAAATVDEEKKEENT